MRHLIVIPAYNEEGALPKTLAALQALPDGYDILVVNDGSDDRTQEVAETFAGGSRVPVHVVRLAINGGIGVAVQTGYVFADKRRCYQYVIQFDADGQHDAAAVPELVRACEEQQLDLCIGSRFLGPVGTGFRSSFLRRIGIRFFVAIIRVLTGVRATDPTSGLRCAGPRAWRRFARHYPEDYPEPETLFWCARNHLRIGEVPVRMHARQEGISSIYGWRPAYYMFKVTLAILFDRLRGKEQP
jgi:glycosyltransferase involved in cell wall biosynthesis